ncbi:MAG: hypothetical protein OEV43_00870 [Coriobacteriia bacterium]|nr:hypothetical protein [Coriobacteriia bacterium]
MTLAIVEIAGRDSFAAAVAAIRERGFTEILPTVALTGTELGDTRAPLFALEPLDRILGDECTILQLAYLQDGELWSALNGRYATVISDRFGVCSPCLACHLYMHLLRVPVSWEMGGAPVIAGERDTHDERVKLSQTPESIDASVRVLAYGDVELLQPIRESSSEDIEGILGDGWPESGMQLGCLFSDNYRDLEGWARYNADGYERYIAEFFEPMGRAVIDAWRAQQEGVPFPTWDTVVRGVLEGK